MTTVEDIEKAVEQLAPRELARFRAWFEAFDAEQFDAAIEQGGLVKRNPPNARGLNTAIASYTLLNDVRPDLCDARSDHSKSVGRLVIFGANHLGSNLAVIPEE